MNKTQLDKTLQTVKNYVDGQRKIAIVGSDTADTAGWYKVAEQTCSGHGDTNITFAVTSTYANYYSGILELQVRSDNTSISCKVLKWLTRIGFDVNHFIVVISGMKWTLYAYQPISQYGRIAFEILSETSISSKNQSWTLTFKDNKTRETTAPTATVKSTDGATVASANKLSTARTISLGGVLSGSTTFDGSGNVSITAKLANGPKSGDWWNAGPMSVNTDGAMEAGKYLDFHHTDTTTNDYSTRLQSNGDTKNTVKLPTADGTLALTSDNVASATKLKTARKIKLTGDVTGEASFDGSADASITATVANDSHSHSNYLPLAGGTLTGSTTVSGGDLIVNTDGGTKSLTVRRNGTAEQTRMYQDDNTFYVNMTNDETAANMKFIMNATDTESGTGTNAFSNATVTFSGSKNGSTVTAGTFSGSLSGNASTATKATQDSAGQQINTTYIKGLSVSGKTITYTKGDGKTGTITTQDTVYTHPTSSGNKHIPNGGSSGNWLKWSADGTATWGSLPTSTTSAAGIVQLNSATNSTSTTQAATASAVKAAYDKANHSHNYIPLSGSTAVTGVIRSNSEFQTTSQTGLRIASTYGTILRSDSTSTYFLLTNKDDPYGNWNSLRPFTINNSTGAVSFGHGITGSLTGNASTATKLQTARTINGTSFNGSANITTANWGTPRKLNGISVNGSADVLLPLEYHTCYVGDSNTNLYHHILASGKVTGDYIDKSITIMIVGHNSGGCLGIAKCTLRTNKASGGDTAHGEINWLVRSNISENQLCYNIRNTAKDTYMDVFYKSNGTYASVTWYVLGEGARGEQSSSTWTKNNTNASGTNAYTEAGMKAIRSYTSTLVSAGTNGTVASANKAKYDNKDQQIDTTYIKGLSVSGKTITYTKGDGSTGTITTQDTNTTYSTGNTSTAGLTKLYTGTGTATDGTMTQAAIKSALDGKAASSHGTHVTYGGNGSATTVSRSDHTHSYLPLAGGTMTGNITFTDVTSTTYPAKSKTITWSGSTDGADIYYQVDASDKGRLVLNTRDDTDCIIMFANNGTSKSTIDNSGNFSGKAATAGTADTAKACSGNAATATKLTTARTLTIGSKGKTFDGSANVSWTLDEIGAAPKSHTHNYAGSGSAGGSANSAVKLANARTINGTAFDGSGAITTANWGTARNISIADSSATNTGSAVSVNGSAAVTLKLPATIKASITGNCSGSSGSCTGNAATATKLASARTISLTGDVTGSASFDGSANASIKATVANDSHTHKSFECYGSNTITSTTNDTTAKWGALKNSVHWYSATGQLTNQPSQYGILCNFTDGSSEVHQLWLTQASGNILHRGGNASNWSGSWRTVLDSENWSGYAAAKSHTHNYAGSGSAGGAANSATKLATARTINGTSFDGSANITTANWGTARNIYIADSSATNTGSAVSVNGSGNATLKLPATIKASITGNCSGSSGSCTGNAATATKLQNARKLGAANFDGTGNVPVTSMLGLNSTKSSGSGFKNKFTKIASINVNGAWSSCSGKLFFTSGESDSINGILNFYFRSNGDNNATSIGLRWETLTNSSYADSIRAVKTSTGKYDLYYMPKGDYETLKFYAIASEIDKMTLYANQNYVDSITAAATSTLSAVSGSTTGNAGSATKLQTARSINGTNFDGTGNITTANWGTARTITIGGKGKSVNGSANVSWTLDEIGAAPKSHTHNYAGSGSAGGSANSAVKLANARTINGTSFDGSANITTANWGKARTLTIGNTGKSVNGSGNVSWSLSEIGAAASSHNHGLLHDNFGVTIADTTTDSGWSMINSSYNGYILKSIRTNASAPAWLVNNYGAGVAFGGSDTKGVLSVAYASPSIRFAGGNGSKPVWYMSLTGSSGKSYNMDSLAAATATKLATARSINGTNFDGTGNITTANWGTARNIYIADSSATNTGSAVSVNGSGNATLKLPATIKASITGNCSGSSGSCTGNAATATKLQTARTINGTSFNGSANITTANWGTSRKLNRTTVNGSADVSIPLDYITCGVGDNNTNNYHLILESGKCTSDYTDKSIVIMVCNHYNNNSFGIAKATLRTNNASGGDKASGELIWIVRSGFAANVLCYNIRNTAKDTYMDVFYKSSGTYNSATIYILGEGARGNQSSQWTKNNTNATGTKAYTETAMKALRSYTSTLVSAVDSGVVNKATQDSAGQQINKTYIKGLSVSGKTITYTKGDGSTGTITTQDTNTTYSNATTSAAGLMSASDKSKLDGIASAANKYSLPTATSSVLGGVKVGSNITVSSGTISLTKSNVTTALGYTPPTTNTTYSAATTSAAGLMSASDKSKLDGIASAANKYSHPTSSGNKHIPSGGSSGKWLKWSADGTATWGSLPTASTSASGIVKLSSSTSGTSETVAATEKAVKTAYDKANHSHNYLPLSGGNMTGAIKSNLTCSHLEGFNGRAIVSSTGSAGSHVAISKTNSTKGHFTLIGYQDYMGITYATKTKVDGGTNGFDHSVKLLDENGWSTFEGVKLNNGSEADLHLICGSRDTGLYLNANNFGIYDWQNNIAIVRYNYSAKKLELDGKRAVVMENYDYNYKIRGGSGLSGADGYITFSW